MANSTCLYHHFLKENHLVSQREMVFSLFIAAIGQQQVLALIADHGGAQDLVAAFDGHSPDFETPVFVGESARAGAGNHHVRSENRLAFCIRHFPSHHPDLDVHIVAVFAHPVGVFLRLPGDRQDEVHWFVEVDVAEFKVTTRTGADHHVLRSFDGGSGNGFAVFVIQAAHDPGLFRGMRHWGKTNFFRQSPPGEAPPAGGHEQIVQGQGGFLFGGVKIKSWVFHLFGEV